MWRTLLTLPGLAVVFGCGSSPSSKQPSAQAPTAIPERPATIYTVSDGSEAWHIQGNRWWNGRPGILRTEPLSRALATITISRTADAECVSLDGVSDFGAPRRLRQGVRFRCGATRFEVVDCDLPEDCRNARIEAIWRTGIAPEFHELAVNYFYNRCRGVQSITLSQDRPLRVGFGSTLELRQGLGLLAQPDTPACRRDPAAELYERHRLR